MKLMAQQTRAISLFVLVDSATDIQFRQVGFGATAGGRCFLRNASGTFDLQSDTNADRRNGALARHSALLMRQRTEQNTART